MKIVPNWKVLLPATMRVMGAPIQTRIFEAGQGGAFGIAYDESTKMPSRPA
ncbi:MAG: hypothetical protein AcusKO_28270 [Acuticoccus sp.]